MTEHANGGTLPPGTSFPFRLHADECLLRLEPMRCIRLDHPSLASNCRPCDNCGSDPGACDCDES